MVSFKARNSTKQNITCCTKILHFSRIFLPSLSLCGQKTLRGPAGFRFPDFGVMLSEKCLPEAKRCDIIRAWTTSKTLMSWLVMLFQHTFNQQQSEVYFTSCVLRIVLFEQDVGVQHCNMQKVAKEFLISNLVCYLRVNAAAASAAGDCTQGN